MAARSSVWRYLDRVLDGDDVAGPDVVDVVDHGGQRRRLARAGRTGDQDQAPHLLGQLGDHLGKPELVGGGGAGPDPPHGQGGRRPLEVGVDPEAARAGQAVGEVGLVLGRGRSRGSAAVIIASAMAMVSSAVKLGSSSRVRSAPANAHPRWGPGLDVEVGAVELGQHYQQSVEIGRCPCRHCTRRNCSLASEFGDNCPEVGAIRGRYRRVGPASKRSMTVRHVPAPVDAALLGFVGGWRRGRATAPVPARTTSPTPASSVRRHRPRPPAWRRRRRCPIRSEPLARRATPSPAPCFGEPPGPAVRLVEAAPLEDDPHVAEDLADRASRRWGTRSAASSWNDWTTSKFFAQLSQRYS